MIARILVALDGSPRAPGVFDKSAEIALRFGARLQPLRVISVPPEFPAAAAGSRADPLRDKLTWEARDDLARIVARAAAGALVMDTPIVRAGEPWRVIIDVSDELHADLIVMGSHGYHGLDRILGTTASRVVNLAHRDVLVVHERSDAPVSPDASRPVR